MTKRTSPLGRASSWLFLGLLAAWYACSDLPTGPRGAGGGYLALQPNLPSLSQLNQFGLSVDNLHLVLTQPPAGLVLRDTVFAFSADSSEIDLRVERIEVRQAAETLDVRLELRNDGTVLFAGTQRVIVLRGPPGTQPPVDLGFRYVGPGANLARIRIVPRDTVVTFGDSLRYAVAATDSAGNALDRYYVAWSTSTGAPVSPNALGTLRAPAVRAGFLVHARTITGAEDSTPVTLIPVPTALERLTGDSVLGEVTSTVPLGVRVKAADGLGVRGIPVRFAVTSGGASVADTMVVSDVNGDARTSVRLGTVPGALSLEARVGGVAPLAIAGAIRAGRAANVNIVSGNGQSGVVATELSGGLAVRVTDSFGNPVANQLVNFVVTSGGGSAPAPFNLTNANGIAAGRWVLGTSTADAQRMEARAVDNNPPYQLITFAVFQATAQPDVAAAVSAVAGDGQSGDMGATLADTLAVQAADRYGNHVPGAAVTWAVVSGGGTITPALAATDAAGLARAVWTLGSDASASQVASATVGALSAVRFGATARLPASATFAKTGGDLQTDTVTAALHDSLAVTVRLAGGQPISGVLVTWSVTGGGGSINPATSVTDASGRATAQWVLGTSPGSNTARASSPLLGGTGLTFTATAVAGSLAAIQVTPGSATLSAVGQTVSLTTASTDAHGNPVAASITWSSSSTSVATVDAQGVVTAVGNGTATITARSGSVSASATITVAQVATQLSVTPGSATLTTAGATATFTASGADAGGHPVAVTVAWTSSDATVATVNAQGLVTAVANGTATITATAGSLHASATVSVQIAPPPPPPPPSNNPPTASFTVACTDLSCTFTDHSTDTDGSVVAWSWSFGDGGTSTAQNPSHNYAAAGTYTVTLAVTDNGGASGSGGGGAGTGGAGASGSASESLTVTAPPPPPPPNSPPTASFSVACTNLSCAFTDHSTDADGSVVSWSWSFGDGSTSSIQRPNHHYAEAGTYTVTLTVTDNGGATGSTSQSVTVTAPPPNSPPTASFSVACTNLSCTFTDHSTDTDGSVVSWSWSFGDGGTSTAQSPTHSYAAAGTYTVTLTVTDNGEATGSTSQSVTVTAPPPPNSPPTASFSVACTNLSCTFTDHSTDTDGSVVSWSWSFGDGGTSSAQDPSHSYAAAGTYTVTLTVTDNGGATGSASQSVTVTAPPPPPPPNSAPTAAFSFSCNDLVCSFTDQSTDADGSVVSRNWNFGDGTTSTVQNPSHGYAAPGTYTVTLTVVDNGGATGSVSHSVAVTGTPPPPPPPPPPPNSPPTASFSVACTNLSCTFTDHSTDTDGSVVSRNWDFGDGTTSRVQNPSHTYGVAGTYTVTLTVTDNGGATGSTSQSVTVTAPPPPNSPPTASFSVACTNLSCTFTDHSTDADGSVVSWNWSFGDGGSSTTRSPSHSYAAAGTFTVTLTVTDNGGATGTSSQSVTVTAPPPPPPPNSPPTASFSMACTNLSCAFTDHSTDADGSVASWSWSFGDGGTSTAQSPTHSYAAAGTYTVSLTVTDNGGATSSTSQSVTVTAPPPSEIQVVLALKGASPINLNSRGVTPLAILTTSTARGEPVTFDATTVDVSSVRFAGASPVRYSIEDVDGDGDLDLVLYFTTQSLQLTRTSTEAELTGRTVDGTPIRGVTPVRVVP